MTDSSKEAFLHLDNTVALQKFVSDFVGQFVVAYMMTEEELRNAIQEFLDRAVKLDPDLGSGN